MMDSIFQPNEPNKFQRHIPTMTESFMTGVRSIWMGNMKPIPDDASHEEMVANRDGRVRIVYQDDTCEETTVPLPVIDGTFALVDQVQSLRPNTCQFHLDDLEEA